MKKLIIPLVMLLASCSSTPKYEPATQITRADAPVFTPTPPPTVTTKSQCADNLFYICKISPVGSLSNNTSIIDSAIACGRCVDGVAEGPIVGVWCKADKCQDVDMANNNHLFGRVIGNSTRGLVSGDGVTLVTALGSFQGNLNLDGTYNLGFLKKDKKGNGFIGKFNKDGSYNHGVEIRKNENGSFTLIAGDFINNKPHGFAYFYENKEYKTYECNQSADCKLYVYDIASEQLRIVLNILAHEFIENVLLKSPVKKMAVAMLSDTPLIRNVEKAYELWGNAQTMQNIGNALSN